MTVLHMLVGAWLMLTFLLLVGIVCDVGISVREPLWRRWRKQYTNHCTQRKR